jgi:hypothetical protein
LAPSSSRTSAWLSRSTLGNRLRVQREHVADRIRHGLDPHIGEIDKAERQADS